MKLASRTFGADRNDSQRAACEILAEVPTADIPQ
jgi:hypothetical protein